MERIYEFYYAKVRKMGWFFSAIKKEIKCYFLLCYNYFSFIIIITWIAV